MIKVKKSKLIVLMYLMVLIYYLTMVPPALSSTEDFTTYTEYEENEGAIDQIRVVDANTLNFYTDLKYGAYLVGDFGEGGLTNFTIEFALYWTGEAPASGINRHYYFAISNVLDDVTGINANGSSDTIWVRYNRANSGNVIRRMFEITEDGNTSQSDDWVNDNGIRSNWRYYRISKSGTALSYQMYNDADMQNLVDEYNITLAEDDNYRYVYPAVSLDLGLYDNTYINGFLENLTVTYVLEDSVSLNTPTNGSTVTGDSDPYTQSFNYTPSFDSGTIYNATLYMNVSGTWQSVASNSSAITNDAVNSIDYNLTTEAKYIWNVGVHNGSQLIWAPSNYTFTFDFVTNPSNSLIGHNQSEANKMTLFYSNWTAPFGSTLDKGILRWDLGSGYSDVETLNVSGGWANFTQTIPLNQSGRSMPYSITVNNTLGESTTANNSVTVPPTQPSNDQIGYNQTHFNYQTLFYSQWSAPGNTTLDSAEFEWDIGSGYVSVENISISGGWANFTQTIPKNMVSTPLRFRITANNTIGQTTSAVEAVPVSGDNDILPEFTRFTEVDPDGDFSITTDLLNYTQVTTGDDDSYSYVEVNETGDFAYDFMLNVTDQNYGDGSQTFYFGLISVSDRFGDYYYTVGGTGVYVVTYQTTADSNTQYTLYIADYVSGVRTDSDTSITMTKGTPYYIKLKRTSGVFTMDIYTDQGYLTLFDSLVCTGAPLTDELRYLQVGMEIDSAVNINAFQSGLVERINQTLPLNEDIDHNQTYANYPTLFYSQWSPQGGIPLSEAEFQWDLGSGYVHVDTVSISGGWANFTQTIPLTIAGSTLNYRIIANNTAGNTTIATSSISVPSVNPVNDDVGHNSTDPLENTLFYSQWSSQGGASLNGSSGRFYWNSTGSMVGEDVTLSSGWLNVTKYIGGGLDSENLAYYFTLDNEYGNTTSTGNQTFIVNNIAPVEVSHGVNNTIYKRPFLFYANWDFFGTLTNATLHTNKTGVVTSENITISGTWTNTTLSLNYTLSGRNVLYYFNVTNSYGNNTISSNYTLSLDNREKYSDYIPTPPNWETGPATNYVATILDQHNDWLFRSRSTGYYHLFAYNKFSSYYLAWHILSKNGVTWTVDNIDQLTGAIQKYNYFADWYDNTTDTTYYDHVYRVGSSLYYGRYQEEANGTLTLLTSYQLITTMGDIQNPVIDINDDGIAVVKYNFREADQQQGGKLVIVANSYTNGSWATYSNKTITDIQESGRIKVSGDNILYIGSYRENSTQSVHTNVYTTHSEDLGVTWSSWTETNIKAYGFASDTLQPKMMVVNGTFYIFDIEFLSPFAKNLYSIDPSNWTIQSIGEVVNSSAGANQDMWASYDEVYNRILLGYSPHTYRWYYPENNTLSDPLVDQLYISDSAFTGGMFTPELGNWTQNPTQMIVGVRNHWSTPLDSFIGQTFTFYEFNPSGALIGNETTPITPYNVEFTVEDTSRILYKEEWYNYIVEAGTDDGYDDIDTIEWKFDVGGYTFTFKWASSTQAWTQTTGTHDSFFVIDSDGTNVVNSGQTSRVTMRAYMNDIMYEQGWLDIYMRTNSSTGDTTGWELMSDNVYVISPSIDDLSGTGTTGPSKPPSIPPDEKPVPIDPWKDCDLTEAEKIRLLNELEYSTIRELRQKCNELGLDWNYWTEKEPYILLIFIEGHGCEPPGYTIDPDDYDGDGVDNELDADPWDKNDTRSVIIRGGELFPEGFRFDFAWIQLNSQWILILLFLLLLLLWLNRENQKNKKKPREINEILKPLLEVKKR